VPGVQQIGVGRDRPAAIGQEGVEGGLVGRGVAGPGIDVPVVELEERAQGDRPDLELEHRLDRRVEQRGGARRPRRIVSQVAQPRVGVVEVGRRERLQEAEGAEELLDLDQGAEVEDRQRLHLAADAELSAGRVELGVEAGEGEVGPRDRALGPVQPSLQPEATAGLEAERVDARDREVGEHEPPAGRRRRVGIVGRGRGGRRWRGGRRRLGGRKPRRAEDGEREGERGRQGAGHRPIVRRFAAQLRRVGRRGARSARRALDARRSGLARGRATALGGGRRRRRDRRATGHRDDGLVVRGLDRLHRQPLAPGQDQHAGQGRAGAQLVEGDQARQLALELDVDADPPRLVGPRGRIVVRAGGIELGGVDHAGARDPGQAGDAGRGRVRVVEQHPVADPHLIAHEVAGLVVADAGPGLDLDPDQIVDPEGVGFALHEPVVHAPTIAGAGRPGGPAGSGLSGRPGL
jgi:hypothetical protein